MALYQCPHCGHPDLQRGARWHQRCGGRIRWAWVPSGWGAAALLGCGVGGIAVAMLTPYWGAALVGPLVGGVFWIALGERGPGAD
jgi:hypothetical protein